MKAAIDKTLELENIDYQSIDEDKIIDKFTVYADSKIFQIQLNFKIDEADNLLNLMKQSPIKTGIMISEFKEDENNAGDKLREIKSEISDSHVRILWPDEKDEMMFIENWVKKRINILNKKKKFILLTNFYLK